MVCTPHIALYFVRSPLSYSVACLQALWGWGSSFAASVAGRAGILLILLWASLAFGQETDGTVYGFVSFSTSRVEVQEDSGNFVTTAQLPLVREVGSTGQILATVQVSVC